MTAAATTAERAVDVAGVFDAVRCRRAGSLAREGCARQMGDLKRLRAWLDSLEVQVMRRQRELAEAGRAESAPIAAAANSGHSARSSRTVADRESTCDALPGLEADLGSGEISGEHVDVIAAVVKRLDGEAQAEFLALESQLRRHARIDDVDTFRRRCRRLADEIRARHADASSDAEFLDRQRAAAQVRRWTDPNDGMHHTHLALDPIRDAAFWDAVSAQLNRLRAADQSGSQSSFEQLKADAVVAAVSAGPAGRRVPEIGVLIDWTTLAGQAHEAGVCETVSGVPLPVSTVRRLACDAEVYPVVLNGEGVALDVGRNSRTATPAQRKALAAEHRTCAFPGCDVPVTDTRIHHVRHWTAHRGPTDKDNLLPVCERHHHLVHEGGWSVRLEPDRTVTWRLPDGSVFHEGSAIDRRSP